MPFNTQPTDAGRRFITPAMLNPLRWNMAQLPRRYARDASNEKAPCLIASKIGEKRNAVASRQTQYPGKIRRKRCQRNRPVEGEPKPLRVIKKPLSRKNPATPISPKSCRPWVIRLRGSGRMRRAQSCARQSPGGQESCAGKRTHSVGIKRFRESRTRGGSGFPLGKHPSDLARHVPVNSGQSEPSLPGRARRAVTQPRKESGRTARS